MPKPQDNAVPRHAHVLVRYERPEKDPQASMLAGRPVSREMAAAKAEREIRGR